MMNENEFLTLIEATFLQIEEAIETCELDIDCETGGGLLKLTFPNGSQVVLNKQSPLKQLWLAGKKQGYHFDYLQDQWICNRSGRLFPSIFNEVCSDAAGQILELIK